MFDKVVHTVLLFQLCTSFVSLTLFATSCRHTYQEASSFCVLEAFIFELFHVFSGAPQGFELGHYFLIYWYKHKLCHLFICW